MKLLKNKYNLLWVLMLTILGVNGQDSVKHELNLKLNYYMPNDKIPYLKVAATEKVERRLIPQNDIAASVYIGEQSDANLLGKIKTDKNGEARVFIPASFKSLWDSSAAMNFSITTEANKIFPSVTTELSITKSKIEIDTATEEGAKKVIVKVMELKDNDWLPAKDVELKIGIRRSLGNVLAGDEETYTTDSTGMVTADFKRDSLPGDAKGNLVLTAWTEDNESFGNISGEKTVNWGIPTKVDNRFFHQRTLWATRFRTPFWLLGLAYGIIISVWGTLIYLIARIIKIRKIGRAAS